MSDTGQITTSDLTSGGPGRTLLAAAVLAVLCAICYANSIHAPLVFDDISNIVTNQAIHIDRLTLGNLYTAAEHSTMPSRPLANISFAVNYLLDGLAVAPFHLVNIFIHFINGCLVYLLALFILRRVLAGTGRDAQAPVYGLALFAAALFVAHPIQIQSVTYTVQRMNSMATLFYLLAVLAYIRARLAAPGGRRRAFAAATPVLWLLALGCKETAATLPAALLLIEWYFFQDARRGFFREHAPALTVLVLLMAVVAWFFLGAHPLTRVLGDYHTRDFTLGQRLLTESRVLIYYISLLLLPLPSRLNLLHAFSISHSLLTPITTLFSVLALAGLLAFALLCARRYRLVSFCILWFFLQCLIESSFIGLELVFEHRLYLPMVACSITAAYLLYCLLVRRPRVLAGAAVILIAALCAGTVIRNQAWASAESLWTDVIRKNPASYRAYYNLANAYTRQGQDQQAIADYRHAIALRPDFAEAHDNLGIALRKQGDLKQALAQFRRAAALDPDDYRTHYNMAIAHNAAGDTAQAITEYRAALGQNPDYAQAQYNLGNLFDRTGNKQQAEFYYRAAIRSDPKYALAYNNLGILLAGEGKFKQALAMVSRAVALKPGFAGGYINLGNIYIKMNRLAQACPQYKKALQINPDTEQIPGQIKQACHF